MPCNTLVNPRANSNSLERVSRHRSLLVRALIYSVAVASLILVFIAVLVAPQSAQARTRHRRSHARAHRASATVYSGNRAAALNIIASETDPSRQTAKASAQASTVDFHADASVRSRVAGLVLPPGTIGLAANPEMASEASDLDDEGSGEASLAGTTAAAPVGPASVVAASAGPGSNRSLYFKSGTLRAEEIDQLNLARITHSSKRQERKKCAKRACNKDLHHYVVQFNERITPQDELDLRSLGAAILRYIPDDALIIEAEAVEAYTIRGSSTSVKAVIPYQAKWKLSHELSNPADAPALAGADEVSDASGRWVIHIRLFPTEEGSAAAQRISEIGGVTVNSVAGRTLVAEVPTSKFLQVAADESIEWMERATTMSLLADAPAASSGGSSDKKTTGFPSPRSLGGGRGDASDLSGWESGTKLVHAPQAWGRGLNGQGQIIGMADSGLDTGDLDHLPQDLNHRVLEGSIFGDADREHAGDDGAGWSDLFGHGTHLAGLMVSTGASLGGRISGVAPGAKVFPESIWNSAHAALMIPTRLRDLFSKAYDKGARIHLNAWGSSARAGEYSLDAQQVDEFVSLNPEMLIVFAAGNSGQDGDHDGRIDAQSIVSPATAKNALTVGASKNVLKNSTQNGALLASLHDLSEVKARYATEPLASSKLSDNERGLAPFSSRGPTSDGRMKPELVAPGTNLLSLRSRAMNGATPTWAWGTFGDSYAWSGGSSDAAALVASSAAIVRQYLIETRKMRNPSAALVKATLMHSAFDLFPGEFGEKGAGHGQEILHARPNSDEGFGRVDLNAATDLGEALMVDDHSGVGAGEAHSYKIRVNSKTRLSATLVYSDTPAALGAAKALVNDLDLVLVDHDGHETIVGDRLNNFETLSVEVPAGNYQVQVRGYNVPQAPHGQQPYALIVSVQ